MHGAYLAIAILFEIIGTIALKWSTTSAQPLYGIITGIAYLISFYFLWACLEKFPLGLAYATWSGVGIAMSAIAGLILFSEKIDLTGIAGLALIIIGVVLINGYSTMGGS